MMIDQQRLLRAIAAVEGNAWNRPGGGLQFTKRTWYDYTAIPYEKAKQTHTATTVALRILEDAMSRLTKAGAEPTVYLLALRWRYGYAGMIQRKHTTDNDYAVRVQNLYLDPSFA